MKIAKVRYFATSLLKAMRQQGIACPSCGATDASVEDRKFLVTTLRRCGTCALMFRSPTTGAEASRAFYQEQYSQGFTSDVPSDPELARLVESGFKGSEKDYSQYIAIIKALGGKVGDRVLDFGCSWGYGSWQLQKAGFKTMAFEISKPRCRYARQKLEVEAVDDLAEIEGKQFDVFFSAHVFEHVPAVRDVLNFAAKVVRPGGLVVAFTPNGSAAFRNRRAKEWHQLWGEVHPNLLDEEFYITAVPNVLLASNPYDLSAIEALAASGGRVGTLNGVELCAAYRMPHRIG